MERVRQIELKIKIPVLIASSLLFLSAVTEPEPIIKGRVPAADMDAAGRIYYIDSAYQLIRHVPGKTAPGISMVSYGEEMLLDAGNPVELFIFYQNSGYVVITDNNLNPVKEFNLYSHSLSPGGFGRSNDGFVWVLDDNTATLKKYNRSGELLQESLVLGQIRNRGRKAARIYDNGAFITVTLADSSTAVLNANLNISGILPATEGYCVGTGRNGIYMQTAGTIVLRPYPGSNTPKATTDTLCTIPEQMEVISVRNRRLLLRTEKGLYLKEF